MNLRKHLGQGFQGGTDLRRLRGRTRQYKDALASPRCRTTGIAHLGAKAAVECYSQVGTLRSVYLTPGPLTVCHKPGFPPLACSSVVGSLTLKAVAHRWGFSEQRFDVVELAAGP